MRISMSAIGSLMLIDVSLPSFLPTCLDHAGHFAAQRQVAQLVATEAELAVHAARPAGQRAAVAQAHRRGVARQPLQLAAGRFPGLVGGARVVDHLEQSGAPRLEFLDGPAALLVAELHCELGHAGVLQCLNGKRNVASSARASSSVFAVVVIVMFMPRIVSILSYSISGKMICSLTPMLKLPRPSKDRPDTPRKSRTRGSAIDTSRSRNSYMRSWRNVT